jgi:transketolase
VPYLYPENEQFQFGKAKLLKKGSDVAFVALGSLMVNEALRASEILAQEGIRAAVLDVLTLKPLDTGAIVALAQECPVLISAENHQIIGGLGSAVAELLAETGYRGKFARVGIQDEFGEVGTQDYLVKRFGLDAETLVRRAKSLR